MQEVVSRRLRLSHKQKRRYKMTGWLAGAERWRHRDFAAIPPLLLSLKLAANQQNRVGFLGEQAFASGPGKIESRNNNRPGLVD